MTSFDELPEKIQSKILGELDLSDEKRQVLRRVSPKWLQIFDSSHYVHLRLSNKNYNQFESLTPIGLGHGMTRRGYCIYLIDMLREVSLSPSLTPHVVKASFIGHFAPYNLRTVLELCGNIESLDLNLISNHQWSKVLRPKQWTPPALSLPNLKVIYLDIDSANGSSAGDDGREPDPESEVTYGKTICFLAYLGSGEFEFSGLETLTFSHWDGRTHTFMNLGLPECFLPEEHYDHYWENEVRMLERMMERERMLEQVREELRERQLDDLEDGQDEEEELEVVRDPGLLRLVVHPPPERLANNDTGCPFLQFLSMTPNLKFLFLGGFHNSLFDVIAKEDNPAHVQGLNKLEEVIVLPCTYPLTLDWGKTYLRTCMLELRAIPKFLGVMASLRSIELTFGTQGGEVEFFYKVIEGNQRTLESLHITFALEPEFLDYRRTGRGSDLTLDLVHFANISKLTSLILIVTNGEIRYGNGYRDSMVNTSHLPKSLRVFKTNLKFTEENLTGVAQNLTNLEVFEIEEYVGVGEEMGHGQLQPGFSGPIQRDLLLNNPNIEIYSIQAPTYYQGMIGPRPQSNFHPREPRNLYPTTTTTAQSDSDSD